MPIPMMFDERTGSFVRMDTGAAEMWGSGAAEMWSGGPLKNMLERFRDNREDRQEGRRADRAEKLLPPGYTVLKESDVEALLSEINSLKSQAKLPTSLSPIAQSPNPQLNMAAAGSIGGGQGLTISPAAAFAGNAAATTTNATSNYPFYIRRYRIFAVGAAGFGASISSISVANAQLINGSPIVIGPDQPAVDVKLAAPVYLPSGPQIIVAYAGGTGIAGASGNFTLILEP